jgi:O-antigen/teichoic acid export membrane protein
MIGWVSKLGILFKQAKNTLTKDLLKIKRSEIYHIAMEYKDFPIYNLPAAFLNNFTQNLVIILLGYFFSATIVGFYAMGERLIQTPMNIIVNSVQRVFMQKISELKNEGRNLIGSFIKTTTGLFLIGFVPFIIIVIWGKQIFTVFLGENWVTAGTYAIVLSPWLFTKFVLPPANAVLIVTRHNRFRFYYQLLAITCKAFSIFLGFRLFKEPELTLLIYSLISAVVNLGLIAKSYTILKGYK